MLDKLLNKKYITYTTRGNESIKLVLKFCRHIGIKNILIQDQGGWITYEQFARKLKLNVVKLKTDYGVIKQIPRIEDAALIVNSLTGYFAEQPMKKIADYCKRNHLLLINDVSGSIGTDIAKYGDIIIGSFGRHKPLSIEKGGFIAADNKLKHHFFQIHRQSFEINQKQLNNKIKKLNQRIEDLHKINKKIKKDLNNCNILHKKLRGINVIAAFKTKKQKQEIIDYCKKNKYPYKECPMNIKVNVPAISIEVQQL